MKKEAYTALHTLEEKHWWYIGARATYHTLLKLGLGKARTHRRLLEVGSGSGGNFATLETYGPVLGLEPSRLALQLTSKWPMSGLVQGEAEMLPFPNNSFDGVCLLGVVEHLVDDGVALREAARVCHPDGAIVLLTSAMPILWSHHDEANRHHRRYTRRQLSEHLHQAGLNPIRLSYQNCFTFLPTLAVRLWQRRFPQPARYDMGQPPRLINTLLTLVLRFEAWLIRFVPLPIGVDLVAVCQPEKDK